VLGQLAQRCSDFCCWQPGTLAGKFIDRTIGAAAAQRQPVNAANAPRQQAHEMGTHRLYIPAHT
jgi:hypothetical protein